jgi:LmbE family N-acetylglucosaminyl deacetylase
MLNFARRAHLLAAISWALAAALSLGAAAPPKVLFVAAHPDDELIAAASIYRLAREQGAIVDHFVITNGEGGYRYSTLAERVYGLELTKEEIGRRELPDIRKRELLAAGRILGVRAHFFLDEPDINNTPDPSAVLNGAWKADVVLSRLNDVLEREKYQFVLIGLPRPDLGGHHLAAAALAVRAVARQPAETRPVLLGAHFTPDPFTPPAGSEFAGFSGSPDHLFDRTRKFGFNKGLDYQIVVNWMVAEHKSQGLYQTNMGRWMHEYFWVFNRADPATSERAKTLFALLAPDNG